MPTNAERRATSEAELVKATIVMIASRGLDGFTIGDVGRATGKSRGLAGHYFGDKDALVAAAVRDLLRSTTPGPIATADEFSNVMVNTFQNTLRDRTRAGALLALLGACHSGFAYRAEVAKFSQHRRDVIAGCLRSLASTGQINPGTDPDTEAAALLALLNGLVRIAYAEPESEAKKFGGVFASAIQRMLSPPASAST